MIFLKEYDSKTAALNKLQKTPFVGIVKGIDDKVIYADEGAATKNVTIVNSADETFVKGKQFMFKYTSTGSGNITANGKTYAIQEGTHILDCGTGVTTMSCDANAKANLIAIDTLHSDYVPQNAFSGCTKLETVVIDYVKMVMPNAFYTCHISKFSARRLEKIHANAFNRGYMTGKIKYPNVVEVETGGLSMKTGSSGEKIYLPKCKILGQSAFNTSLGVSYVYLPSLEVAKKQCFMTGSVTVFDLSGVKSIPTLESENGIAEYDANGNYIGDSAKNIRFIVPDELFENWKNAPKWTLLKYKLTRKSTYDAGKINEYDSDDDF